MSIIKINSWRKYEFIRILFTVLFVFIVTHFSLWTVGVLLPYFPEPVGSRAGLFVQGAQTTLLLTISAGSLGILLGIGFGLAKLSSNPFIKLVSTIYSLLFRGTPLLVQIFFIYYALPALIPTFQFSELVAAMIALSLNVGAYNADVIRSGVLAIPKSQTEAARSLGLSKWKTMRWVILPQAIKIVIPPLLNNLVALLKDSALASSIGLLELTLSGNRITSETFLPVPVLITVASIYLILTMILSIFTHFFEKGLK